MDPDSRQKLIALYESSLRRHGPTARAVKWGDERSQQARFRVLAEVGAWDGASVADIGCGLGDFFGFLQAAGAPVLYTGYDITPGMVEAARRKYPHPSARFEVRDILEEGLGGTFDYVVASGTFNLRVADHDLFLRRILAAMYAGCRRAVAFNVLQPDADPSWSALVDWAGYYTVPLEEVAAWCRELCPRVEVRSGYGVASEATLFLYRPA